MFSEFVDSLAAKTEQNNQVNEGDYYNEQGLLCCGKCRTPKQMVVKIPELGIERKPYCMCKCESEKWNKEDEERKEQERQKQIYEIRRLCFSDEAMIDWNFANDDMANEKVTKAMQNYVDNFPELKKQGKGLLLYGQCGTGKTYAACEVANALIDKGYSVLVTNFARVVNKLQSTYAKQEYIDSLNDYSLLVIDDLSAERDTEYMNEQIFQVVDARYRANLPMIITTNLSIETVKNPDSIAKKRIYERVLEKCHPIKVDGKSRRVERIRKEYGTMQQMLGLD